MSTQRGCIEQVVGGCLLSGFVGSILMLSLLPFLVGIGIAWVIAMLADLGTRAGADYAVGRTGSRSVNGETPEVQLMWRNQDGIWVEALEQIYHVPFATYPVLARASIAELCDVQLLDEYRLYWQSVRQVIPLYAIKVSRVPYSPVSEM